MYASLRDRPVLPALVVAVALGTGAGAAEVAWIAPAGGDFGVGPNWLGGEAPLATDVAVFELDAVYDVMFTGARVTDRVLVRGGAVTFDLAVGAYELTNPLPTTPGVTIGVGDGDNAELRLADGPVAARFVALGAQADAVGALALAGPAARLDALDHVTVGVEGVGILEIGAGAVVTSRNGVLGATAGAYGATSADGSGTAWTCDGPLTVGGNGAAVLSATGGATVASVEGVVAAQPGSSGDVVLSGAGTAWTIDGPLDVGRSGIGTLRVEDGARLTCRVFATIGTFPGAFGGPPGTGGYGTVTVTGPGSTWTVDGGFFDGDLFVGLGGVGVLRVEAGGAVHVRGLLDAVDNSVPGDVPPLVVVLASASDFAAPAVTVNGPADLEQVRVELLDASAAEVGATFRLVESAASLAVDAVDLPALPDGRAWSIAQTPTRLTITVVPSDCVVATDDCDGNGIDDACDAAFDPTRDCDEDGIPDACAIADGTASDCDGNEVPDACDIALGTTADCDGNGVPDACEALPPGVALTAPFPEPEAELGRAVASDGVRMITGAPFAGGAGAAEVFRRIGGVLVHEATLVAPDGVKGDQFGAGVDVDGDRAIVGAWRAAGTSGRATIFRRVGSAWTVEQTIPAPDGDQNRWFGSSVLLDGDRAIVGAALREGVPWRGGAVYEFRRTGGRWTLAQRLVVSDGGTIVVPGATVSLDGDRLAVGVRGFATGASPRGIVTVFAREDDVWIEEATLKPLASEPSSFGVLGGTGAALALRGDLLAVRGHFLASYLSGDSTEAVVFVYRRAGAAWIPEAILAPFAPADDGFGDAVVIDGTRIVVGHTSGAGAAIVFGERADGWTQTARLVPRDAVPGDRVGAALAIDGTRVLVGAPGVAANGDDAGAVYDFEPDGTDCDGNGAIDHCEIAADPGLDANGDGRLDACGPVCPGDLDGDGTVGGPDLDACLDAWGSCPPGAPCPADLDGNGTVGFFDLAYLLNAWGPCPNAGAAHRRPRRAIRHEPAPRPAATEVAPPGPNGTVRSRG